MRHDWQKVSLEYITGPDTVTLQFLSETYGVNHSTISKRCSREGWVKQRLDYRESVTRKAKTKLADREVKIRERHLNLAEKILQKAEARVDEITEQELTVAEARKWIETAADMQRKAVGIADEVAVRLGEINLAELTTEQLERLAAGEDPEEIINQATPSS